MTLDLPYPPSVNTYWRRHGHIMHISNKGREYRKLIVDLLSETPRVYGASLWLNIEVKVYPPDRRVRDLDNLPKALFDALKHAGLYADDSQIARFSMERMPVHKGGAVRLIIDEHEPSEEKYEDS